MRIFEFHFNPKLKEDLVLDSFCYEPEKAYEKRLGDLYIVGLLKNTLPQNKRLLKRLAEIIKEKYYSSRTDSSERALKSSLKEANKFLDSISKSGDVSWLGNLDFFILSIKDSKLNFAKVGDIKPILIRAGQITDIDKKVQIEDLEPYPLKVFSNIVSGKLAEKDLILVLTQDIFEFFKQEKILTKIAKLEFFDHKQFKKILNGQKKNLNEISGIFLLIQFIKETFAGKKQTISEKNLEKFSLKKIFAPVLKIFKKLPKKPFSIKIAIKKKKKGLKGIKIPRIKFRAPKFNIRIFKKTFSLPKLKKIKGKKSLLSQNLILISGLIILLVFGFAFSKFEQNRKIKIYSKQLEEIQEKLQLSESFLLLKDTNLEAFQKSNLLLEESWNKILIITKDLSLLPKDFTNQILELKNEISSKLLKLNKLEQIENPELVFEFNRLDFVPHNLLVNDDNIYFFSPYLKNIYDFNAKRIIEINKVINSAIKLNNSALFFSKPDKLIILKNNEIFESEIQIPYQDFEFSDLASFHNNLYFIDKKIGQIIKYGFLNNFEWDKPVSWLNQKEEGAIGANSMAIDSSVWILKNNLIYKYYKGEFQKEFEINIFPNPKDLVKIYTSSNLSYLYILEPVQERIVILDKKGNIIKQFQSEKFDNLLDFAVSEDGNIIYLLNGLNIYKINL
ncbi:MAG TPA: hypothetical protein ENH90_01240 [bacterium]|nr:hypothetical protein [bacterium]